MASNSFSDVWMASLRDVRVSKLRIDHPRHDTISKTADALMPLPPSRVAR